MDTTLHACLRQWLTILPFTLSIFKTIQVQLAYSEEDVTYSLANLLIFTQVEPW